MMRSLKNLVRTAAPERCWSGVCCRPAARIFRVVPSFKRGMTLVEVVLALGVVSVAIVPLIGLLALGLNTSSDSNDDAAKARIIGFVQSDLRSRNYETNAWTATNDTALTKLNSTLYFDVRGNWVSSDVPTGANAARAVFSTSFADVLPSAQGGVSYKILIRWPYPAFGQQASIPCRLFRYE